ncbi:Kelch-like protein 36, partial [Ophiophagus hannah]
MFTIGMREASQKEVELFGVTCLGFKAILDFLYGGDLSSGNVDSILETAHLLQIWKVVDFCCEYLENEVDEENYFYLQELASIFNLKCLDSFIDMFIMKNFVTLSLTSDFLQNITIEKLCHYLGSRGMQEECELNLLPAALRWLVHHREREKETYRVLENIHFSLIPENGRLHLVKPAIRCLFPKETRCEDFVEEAIHYHNQVAAPPVLQNKRMALRSQEEKYGLELSNDTCFLDPKMGQWVKETLLPTRREQTQCCGSWRLASMRQQRADFYLGAIRDMLVAVGGRNENGALFMYGHAGAVHKELIYISRGHDYQTGLFLKNLLCYGYRTDTWEERRPMITAQGFHGMSTLQDDIYAIGGSDNHLESVTRFDILEVESYSPKCNQWTRVAPLLQANSEFAVATWDGKIYILGGYSCKTTNSFSRAIQVYDKTSKQWQNGSDLPKAFAGVSA